MRVTPTPRQRTPFPFSTPLCDFQVLPCSRAQKEGERWAAESNRQLRWPLRLQVQLRSRRGRRGVPPTPKKRSAKGVPGLCCCLRAARRISSSVCRVPSGTLYLLRGGQERACRAAARAAGQSAPRPWGRATRARSSPAEHSWMPDKGPRSGKRSAHSVCFLPAGSVPATLGFSKSLAQ